MIRLATRSLVALVLIAALSAFPASAAMVQVDCDRGQTISKALEKAKGFGGILEISVTGVCNETVTIRRGGVRIYGNHSTHIIGTVRVFGGDNVRLFDLAISGPGHGLIVSVANAVAVNLYILDNDGHGLVVRRDARVWLLRSTIVGNCENIEDDDCSSGAFVDNSSLTVTNSSIANGLYGIDASVGSSVVLETAGQGITEIANNSAVGVQVGLHSIADLRGNTQIHDNRYHAIFAHADSGVQISQADVVVTGNIGCADEESSFSNWGGGSITSTDCTGF